MFFVQIIVYLWYLPTILILSGDIETNPGPTMDNNQYLSICHWNLNSITTDKFLKIPLIFLICIINFFIYIILQSSADIAILIHPIELNLIFGLCIPLQKSSISLYEHILESFIHIALILVPFPLIISNLCNFFMNVSTIPYLLSKMNISCNFNLNFCKSSYNKISSQVGQPLLS